MGVSSRDDVHHSCNPCVVRRKKECFAPPKKGMDEIDSNCQHDRTGSPMRRGDTKLGRTWGWNCSLGRDFVLHGGASGRGSRFPREAERNMLNTDSTG